ncbi:MAG: putative rane protein, partial [Gemmatimonadetes bacterium]|nr:putative rane protein [Gemmatimonadota bacterium]
MRSRAERRRVGEWVLRAALFAVLLVALWRSLQRTDTSRVARTTSATAFSKDLERIVASNAVGSVDLATDAMPSRADRDALVALRRNGVAVRWNGSPPPLALEATRAREPEARARLHIIGGGAQVLALVDSAGLLDSVRAGAGATVDAASIVGTVRVGAGTFAATAHAPKQETRRAVLVLGRADWETKFVMQALSEAGWVVRARIPAAPNVDVRDDGILPIDTARYDVVVALDSSS